MSKNIIGENIKRIRKERRMTQDELANLLNKSTISIKKWESGDRTPRNEVLVNIANALRVSLADLYDGCDTNDIIPNWLKEMDKKIDLEKLQYETKTLEVTQNLLKHYNYSVYFYQGDEDTGEFKVEIKNLLTHEVIIIPYKRYLDFVDKLKYFIDFEFYCMKK